MIEARRWADLCANKPPIWTRRLIDQFAVPSKYGHLSVNAGINGRLWTFSDGSTLCHDGGKFLVMRPRCQT